LAQAQLKLWEPVVSLASLLNSPSSCCQVMARRLSLPLAIFFLSVSTPCLTTRGKQKDECAADEVQVDVTRHGQEAMLSPSSGDAAATKDLETSIADSTESIATVKSEIAATESGIKALDSSVAEATEQRKAPVTDLWLIRHGLKEGKEAPNTGDWTWPLSQQGHEQAKELAAFLANEFNTLGVQPELWASPFLRTVQTATPIAKALQIPIRLDPGLGEARKTEPTLIPANARLQILQEYNIEEYTKNLSIKYNDTHEASAQPEQSENEEELYKLYFERAETMAGVLKNAEVAGKHLIAVSHGSVVTLLIAFLTNMALEDIGGKPGQVREATVFHLRRTVNGWEVDPGKNGVGRTVKADEGSPYPSARGSWYGPIQKYYDITQHPLIKRVA